MYDSYLNDRLDNERILVFSSGELLIHLAINKTWYADGTFKLAPSLFAQLYTIHALSGGRTIACIFALLPAKTEESMKNYLDDFLS